MSDFQRGLFTVADYLRLPGVAGAHDCAEGLGTLTIYVERDADADHFAWLARHIDDERPVNLLVRLERDRRTTTDRRQT